MSSITPIGYNFRIENPPEELIQALAVMRTRIEKRRGKEFKEARQYYTNLLFVYDKERKVLTIPRGLMGLICNIKELSKIKKLSVLVKELSYFMIDAIRLYDRFSHICRAVKYASLPYVFNVDDYTTYVIRLHPELLDTVSVRDLSLWESQKRALESIIYHFIKFGSATLWATTGSGKTRIALATHIAVNHGLKPREKSRKTVFLTLSKTLAEQGAKKFRRFGIQASVFHSEIQDLSGEINCITVGSVYAAMKRTGVFDKLYGEYASFIISKIERELKSLEEEREVDIIETMPLGTADRLLNTIRNAKLVIYDECHHVPSMMSQATVLLNKGGFTLGLSATPWRDDDRTFDIYATVGSIMPYFIDNKTLIREGNLVPARIVFFHIPYPPEDKAIVNRIRRMPRGGLRAWHMAVKMVIYNENRNKLIKQIAELLPTPTLILVREIRQGKIIADSVNGFLFYSVLRKAERERVISSFMTGSIERLVATTIADEGLDVPSLRSMIQAQGGKSSTRAYQRIGRVVRVWPGKTFGIFIDIWDEFPFFEEHSKAREVMYKLEEKEGPNDVGWEIYHVKSIDELKRLLQSWGITPERSDSLLVPYFPSKRKNYCSEASAQMFIYYLADRYIDQDEIHNVAPYFEHPGYLEFIRRYVPYAELTRDFNRLIKALAEGRVAIIRYRTKKGMHSVFAYALSDGRIIYNDPDIGPGVLMAIDEMEKKFAGAIIG